MGSDDWDKAKDLQVSLVEVFLRSNWAPGDLAIAANNAGILRKIFKRLHRTHGGDRYAASMHKELVHRNDPQLIALDVNLKDRVITVRRSVVEGMEGTPKNGEISHVPINPSVVAEIKKHLNGRKSGLVWHSNRCTPRRLNNGLKLQLKPSLKKLKIKFPGRNGMHACRHGRISYLAYSGVTFAVIREWVGHGSDAMIKHLHGENGSPTTRAKWRSSSQSFATRIAQIRVAMATKLPYWNQLEPNPVERRLAQ